MHQRQHRPHECGRVGQSSYGRAPLQWDDQPADWMPIG